MSDRAPESDPTTESLRFLQHRVAQFGRVGGVGGLVFWAFRASGHLVVGEPGQVAAPGMVFHLLGALSLAAVSLLCSGRPRSRRFVHAAETAGLLGSSVFYGLMGTQLPVMVLRPDLIVLLAINFGMMARAVFVPSTAGRTLVLTSAVGAPLVGLNAVAAGSEAFAVLQPLSPVPLVLTVTVESAVWWTLTVALCSMTSRVLYGLRQEVRQARQLGQYVLEEKLGEGGMGVVYRARHAMLRRPTAVKLLSTAGDEGTIARFEREVRLTARLAHPNTVTVYDYGRTPDGVFYYAMELLVGANLREVVDAGGRLPPARVIHVLDQVASSLVEAHGVGLIHRDIKPANILLCEQAGMSDVAKVLDFGLVKELDSGEGVSLTMDGTVTGTPLYMSPEAITSPGAVDGRTDLYALGAVGYFLLTGTDVFAGRSVVEVCGHHLHSRPEPPSQRVGGPVPPDLETLVLSCLAKTPGERPGSAGELRRRLGACADSGRWTEEEARAWWARHGDALAQRRKTAVRAPSGPSLLVDFGRRNA